MEHQPGPGSADLRLLVSRIFAEESSSFSNGLADPPAAKLAGGWAPLPQEPPIERQPCGLDVAVAALNEGGSVAPWKQGCGGLGRFGALVVVNETPASWSEP